MSQLCGVKFSLNLFTEEVCPWLQEKMKELVFSIDTSRSEISDPPTLGALHLTLFYLLQCNMYLPTYFRIHGAAMPISLDLRNFFRQVFCLSCKSFTIMTIKGPKVKPLKNLFFFFLHLSVFSCNCTLLIIS